MVATCYVGKIDKIKDILLLFYAMRFAGVYKSRHSSPYMSPNLQKSDIMAQYKTLHNAL